MTNLPLAAMPVANRVRSLRLAGIFVFVGMICSILPFVENSGLYMIVLALGVACAAPAWFDWVNGRLDYFEPVHAISFMFFVYFGLGSIWTVNNPTRVAYDIHLVPYISGAAFYCFLGYIGFLVGYYAPFRTRAVPRLRAERLDGNVFLLVIATMGLAGLLSLGVLETAIRQGRSFSIVVATMSQLWPLFLFSWALAWVVFFSGMASRGQKWVLFGVLVPGVLIAGYSTFSDKSMALTLVVVPMVARWYAKHKMPWTFLIVTVLVLIFVLFPLYNTFRWFDLGISRGERVGMAVETIQSWDSENFMRFSLGTFKARLAMVNSVAIVMRDSPKWVPLRYGETIFMPTVAYFIPRVFWPEKPAMNFGREFGRTFRVTNVRTGDVFIGPTIPGELYWNFGLPGIVIGMALMGTLVRFLYRRYGGLSGVGPILIATHIVLLVQWVHFVGGTVAGGLVGVVRLVIMLEVLRWLGRNYGLLKTDES